MHRIGLVGGTFDRFHSGHASLIETGLSRCQNLEIWITHDEIAQQKDTRVNNWQSRSEEIFQSFGGSSSRVSTHVLSDELGPAPHHPGATAIVCTKETIANCEGINNIRSQNGLEELEIIPVERVMAWDGEPISSSRIRSGCIDRNGQPWIPESFRGKDASLTPEVESQLKDPFGELIEGSEEDPSIAIRSAIGQIGEIAGPLIAVGDVTALALQQEGRPADIALVDGLTKREEWPGAREIDPSKYENILTCSSPAGSLTHSLLEACEKSISSWKESGESTLIQVDGEEDLAPLLLHPLAPIGSAVLYGQPGKGVVIRWSDEDSKGRCRNLIRGLETH
tara:strand:- start:2479 stop:3492 length:1014 start_codon:yes stop_codon:yes gene_type:complete